MISIEFKLALVLARVYILNETILECIVALCRIGGYIQHFGRRAFVLNPRLLRQIVYAFVSPKAKLFSLQLNNQSKILFR